MLTLNNTRRILFIILAVLIQSLLTFPLNLPAAHAYPSYNLAVTSDSPNFCDSCIYALHVQLMNADGSFPASGSISDSVIIDSTNSGINYIYDGIGNWAAGAQNVTLDTSGHADIYVRGPGDGSSLNQTITFNFQLNSDHSIQSNFDQFFTPMDGAPTASATSQGSYERIDILPAVNALTELWDMQIFVNDANPNKASCAISPSNQVLIIHNTETPYAAPDNFAYADGPNFWWINLRQDANGIPKSFLLSGLKSGCTYDMSIGDYRGQNEAPHFNFSFTYTSAVSYVTPNLNGLSKQDAEAAITNAGFSIGLETATAVDASPLNNLKVKNDSQTPAASTTTTTVNSPISFTYYVDTPTVSANPDGGFVATIPVGATVATFSTPETLHAEFAFSSPEAAANVSVVSSVNPAPRDATPFQINGDTQILDIRVTGIVGPVQICVDGSNDQRLFHFIGGVWVDITSSHTLTKVCGTTSSFSPFAVGKPIPASISTVPVISAPIQKSSIASLFPVEATREDSINVTIYGNFVETISNIQVDSTMMPAGSWIQTPKSISFIMKPSKPGDLNIQLYNGSMPLLNSQKISIQSEIELPSAKSSAKSSTKRIIIKCINGKRVRHAHGFNPVCPAGFTQV